MSVLPTEVLPIEYDDKTKTEALKTKEWLNANPPFFKAFLPKLIRLVILIRKVLYILAQVSQY